MPKLSDHTSSTTTKMLLIGDTGSGKTGSLGSLASAGYNVRILDLDNGADILRNLLRPDNALKLGYAKDSIDRVDVVTITDPMKKTPTGRLVPSKPTVWPRTLDLLGNWKDGEINYGPISSWTSQDILVIDSLTLLSQAAMNYILGLNGRLGARAEQGDWYQAQQLIEGLLQMLYDSNVLCNVIIMSHIVYIGEDNGPQHGYPSSLGKALSPRIGRYFNSVLMTRSTGSGTGVKKAIHTNPVSMVELKNTNPLGVPPSYPLESGLASYFRDVRK